MNFRVEDTIAASDSRSAAKSGTTWWQIVRLENKFYVIDSFVGRLEQRPTRSSSFTPIALEEWCGPDLGNRYRGYDTGNHFENNYTPETLFFWIGKSVREEVHSTRSTA